MAVLSKDRLFGGWMDVWMDGWAGEDHSYKSIPCGMFYKGQSWGLSIDIHVLILPDGKQALEIYVPTIAAILKKGKC